MRSAAHARGRLKAVAQPRSPCPAAPRLRSALAAFALCASAGCAVLPAPTLPGTAGVSTWHGRFAVTLTPADQSQAQRSSGRFTLSTSSKAAELELISPLGATLALARVDERGATMSTADGKRWDAASAEALTEQALGWRVPVLRLPGWLRGEVAEPLQTEPAPGGGTRLVQGRDGDWTVQIDQWSDHGPQRMTLRWPADPAAASTSGSSAALPHSVELRLAIDDAQAL